MATSNVDIVIDATFKGKRQVQQADDAIDRLNKGVKGAEDTWKKYTKAAIAVGGALVAVGLAAQRGYQAIKAGAELELARSRFDALAGSIGATADVMLNDMRKATGGMISDAELITGATDLINTGIAGTADEVARFSSVVGRLGLDMGVLNLTIVNQSKMRLDSLGLSVQTVDAKYQKLRETMSDAEAWKFAVLESLEEKTALFGDAAQTTAGKMANFEASLKNARDAALVAVSEGFEPLVEALVAIGGDEGAAFVQLFEDAGPLIEFAAEEMADLVESIGALAGFAAGEGSGALGFLVQLATWPITLRRAIREGQDEMRGQPLGFAAMFDDDVVGGSAAIEEQWRRNARAARELVAAQRALVFGSGGWEDQQRLLQNLARNGYEPFVDNVYDLSLASERLRFAQALSRDTHVEATVAMEDHLEVLRLSKDATEDAADADEERNTRMRQLAEAYRLIDRQAREAEAAMGRIFAEESEKADWELLINNPKNVAEALWEATRAAEAQPAELALLGIALGRFSEAQAIAYLKSAALAVKIQELGRMIAGGMPVEKALENLRNFQSELDNTTGDLGEVEAGIERARSGLGTLDGATANVYVNTYWKDYGTPRGPGGMIGGGDSGPPPHQATGSPSFQGGMTWVGEFGPELVSLPRGSRITSTNVTHNQTATINVANTRQFARIMHRYMSGNTRPQRVTG